MGAAALTGSLVGASGAALVGTSIAAAAIGGAVGSIVSQELGVAIGAQDSFSWKNVALGAIGAGVGAGLAGSSQVGDLLAGLTKPGALAAEAAANSAITQGIGVTTGLQSSFNWCQVAESAVAGPIAAAAGKYVGQQTDSIFAGQVASGATGSLIRQAVGGKVSVTTVLTDAFGNSIGNSIATGIAGNNSLEAQTQEVYRKLNADTSASIDEFNSQLDLETSTQLALAQDQGQIHGDTEAYFNRLADNIQNAQQLRILGRDLALDVGAGVTASNQHDLAALGATQLSSRRRSLQSIFHVSHPTPIPR